MALCHARYNRQGRFCAEIALILLPVWKRPPPSCSATTISYKRTKIVAIWQHRKRVLGIFSPCMQQKQLLRNFRSKIWPRHSLRRPRFPIRQMHFHYRVMFTGYIRCFCATSSHGFVTLTVWPWECFVYSASYVRPTYQFLLSYDYRLLSYE